jgi:hypothetical protein
MSTTATATAIAHPSATEQMRNSFLTFIGMHASASSPSKEQPSAPPLLRSSSSVSSTESTADQPLSLAAAVEPASWTHYASTANVTRKVSMTESLKYDPKADEHFKRKAPSASSPTAKSKKRLVFRETVQVMPIPMRTEYSTRVRSRLWSSATELHENAVRNTVEFAHEGYELERVSNSWNALHCAILRLNLISLSFCLVLQLGLAPSYRRRMHVCLCCDRRADSSLPLHNGVLRATSFGRVE